MPKFTSQVVCKKTFDFDENSRGDINAMFVLKKNQQVVTFKDISFKTEYPFGWKCKKI